MMRILFALLMPPVGLILCNKYIQTIFSLILLAAAPFTGGITYIIAMIHAVLVVNGWQQDRRQKSLIEAIKQERE